MGDELLAEARAVEHVERAEAAWWAAVMDEVEESLREVLQQASQSPLPAQVLEAGLVTARRGMAQARAAVQDRARLLEDDLRGGLTRLGELSLATGAALFALALEASARGLPGQSGFGVVDWLAQRCPWLSRSELGDMDAVVRAARSGLNIPLVEAVAQGRTPARRGAVVARALAKLSPVLDPEGYEAFVKIFVDAACDPAITDAVLHEIIETAIKALLDEKDKQRREKLAHEARSFTSRRLANGLTRFTIDAPEADAAVLNGIVTSKLAAPASTDDAPDLRSATQRRYDAFRSVLGRGTTCPTGTPTMPRATLVITMRLSDLLGQTRGAGLTTTGEVLSAGQVRRLACEAELVPAVLGTESEILDVGREHRLATPAQVRALRLRDKGCTFPGCTVPPEWCIAHHTIWWSRGGATDMDTLALLCERHHTHVHQHDLEAEINGSHVTWHV
ncbi:HNH endonuclease signature motif containing protein [Ornithinimicrobium sufpigmenti]|uniref:HNH endonuclease signature motif containing protein n=1 Tax=Ornithinimicrobium sufpigmenti TaxID=2508882 RepID=UPI0015E16124|nr:MULTISPECIES: HNH endonuclease signature motif containing protein [unclassified Ornithinimicrobium]